MFSPETSSVCPIPDLVNNIMHSVRQVTQMLLNSKDPAVDDEIAKEQIRLEKALLDEGTAAASTFNHYVLILGMEFSCGDDDAVRELRMVYATLPQDDAEVKELRNQQRGYSEIQRLDFTRQLKSQVTATKTALQELAIRKGFFDVEEPSQTNLDLREQVRKLFPVYDNSAIFCEGALHLQKHASAALSAIASVQPDGGGYVCHHCNLDLKCMEIGEAGTITFTEAEWKTLAACHMRAHFSFKNLAAWYKCGVCHDWGVEPPQVFVSPVVMMEHLKNHWSGNIEKALLTEHLVSNVVGMEENIYDDE